MKKFVVVGSLNVDYVANVDHMPAVGETVLSKDLSIIPGGKGANQAFTLGRMGADVILLGAVGKDSNADFELASLKQANVDIRHIARSDKSTGLALISVNKEGDNSIIAVQGANLDVSKEYIESKIGVLREVDIVVMQLEIPLETVVYTAKVVKDMGKTVILDPAPALGYLPDELLKCVDILKPNEIELAALTGISTDVKSASEALLRKGVDCVLTSLGENGVFAARSGNVFWSVPCKKVQAVDTTAAGDSFTAAVAFALAKGQSIRKAVEFAVNIAALVVTRKGAQTSIPTSEEAERIWSKS